MTGIEAIEEDIAEVKASSTFGTFGAFVGVHVFEAINEMSSRGGEATRAAASDPTETAAPRVSAALPRSGRVCVRRPSLLLRVWVYRGFP